MTSNDSESLPAVHPRSVLVERARTDLLGLILDWRERHSLTPSEECLLLAEAITRLGSQCVKAERRE